MKEKPLTNKAGLVRELTGKDIRDMRTASEVLPADLLNVLPGVKLAQQERQKSPAIVLKKL